MIFDSWLSDIVFIVAGVAGPDPVLATPSAPLISLLHLPKQTEAGLLKERWHDEQLRQHYHQWHSSQAARRPGGQAGC